MHRRRTFPLAMALVLLLAACSVKPHTAAKVQDYLEKRYGAPGRFTLVETLEEGVYLFCDGERGIDFVATSTVGGWGDNAIVPAAGRTITSHLDLGIRYANAAEAEGLTREYGLHLLAVDTMRAGGGRTQESVYVTGYTDLGAASGLCFALSTLHNLEPVDIASQSIRIYYSATPGDALAGEANLLATVSYRQLAGADESGAAVLTQTLQDACRADSRLPQPQ